MSDFLDELRREVTDAHAAHRARSPRRRRARSARHWLPRAALGAAVVASILIALAVIARDPDTPDTAVPRVLGQVRVGGIPVDGTAFDESIWVADSAAAAVVRVDPAERRVQSRIPVGGQPQWLAAADDGGLWLHAGVSPGDQSRLSRIDPDTERVTLRVAAGPEGPMTVAGGAVWAAVWAALDNRPREGLYRFRARDGEPLGRIDLTGIDHLAAAGEDVWALTSNGTLARLDAGTGRIERRFPQLVSSAGVAAGANALAVDSGGAWVLSTPEVGGGTVVRVEGDEVVRRLRLPARALPVVAVARDGLWTATGDQLGGRNRALRLDPRTGRTTAAVALGAHRPVALVTAGDELWSVGGDGTLVAIGS